MAVQTGRYMYIGVSVRLRAEVTVIFVLALNSVGDVTKHHDVLMLQRLYAIYRSASTSLHGLHAHTVITSKLYSQYLSLCS